MDIKNLTPHDINVLCADGSQLVLPKSETPARCCEIVESIDDLTLDGIPIVKKTFGDVVNLPTANLPESVPDTLYVVSAIVKAACPDRNDLLLVNDTVRDEQGRIIGCKSFAR
jgi:hypothetical protein